MPEIPLIDADPLAPLPGCGSLVDRFPVVSLRSTTG